MVCDAEFNLPECGFDGGDCCPVMDDPRLGDGFCDGYVFNIEICGFDEGDCDQFNRDYPNCAAALDHRTNIELWNEFRRLPHFFALGDGICDNVPMYMGPECGYDGGDCKECFLQFEKQMEMEEFIERHFDQFGDGTCNPQSPFNIEICGYEGRDCYECMIHELGVNDTNTYDDFNYNASKLGNGECDGGAYISHYCYYDGGDCLDFIEKYPNCDAEFPSHVGNSKCDSEYDYKECGYDGGDCENLRETYNLHDCFVDDLNLIGNGECDGGEYLTEDCAWDGGDCANCTMGDKTMSLLFIGDGICDGKKYMTEECGYDGGDCDKCFVKDILRVGDGICDQELNTFQCNFDGGDCIAEFGANNTSSKSRVNNVFGGSI